MEKGGIVSSRAIRCAAKTAKTGREKGLPKTPGSAKREKILHVGERIDPIETESDRPGMDLQSTRLKNARQQCGGSNGRNSNSDGSQRIDRKLTRR